MRPQFSQTIRRSARDELNLDAAASAAEAHLRASGGASSRIDQGVRCLAGWSRSRLPSPPLPLQPSRTPSSLSSSRRCSSARSVPGPAAPQRLPAQLRSEGIQLAAMAARTAISRSFLRGGAQLATPWLRSRGAWTTGRESGPLAQCELALEPRRAQGASRAPPESRGARQQARRGPTSRAGPSGFVASEGLPRFFGVWRRGGAGVRVAGGRARRGSAAALASASARRCARDTVRLAADAERLSSRRAPQRIPKSGRRGWRRGGRRKRPSKSWPVRSSRGLDFGARAGIAAPGHGRAAVRCGDQGARAFAFHLERVIAGKLPGRAI